MPKKKETDDDFEERGYISEAEQWKGACATLGNEIAELLEIHASALADSYHSGAPAPSIMLAMTPPEIGILPKVKIKVSIPRLKGSDERDVDLNQMRLPFRKEGQEND